MTSNATLTGQSGFLAGFPSHVPFFGFSPDPGVPVLRVPCGDAHVLAGASELQLLSAPPHDPVSSVPPFPVFLFLLFYPPCIVWLMPAASSFSVFLGESSWVTLVDKPSTLPDNNPLFRSDLLLDVSLMPVTLFLSPASEPSSSSNSEVSLSDRLGLL